MTWNHFSLIVLCLTFFVSKFHGSELNSLFITSVWSKMSIFSLSSIIHFYHQGSFFINCSDIWTAEAMGAKLVLNEKMFKKSSFWDQSCICSSNHLQTRINKRKSSLIKEEEFELKMSIFWKCLIYFNLMLQANYSNQSHEILIQ